MYDNNFSYPYQTHNNNSQAQDHDETAPAYSATGESAPTPSAPQHPAESGTGAPVGWQRLPTAPVQTGSTPSPTGSTPNAPSPTVPNSYGRPVAPNWTRPSAQGAAPAYTAPGAPNAPGGERKAHKPKPQRRGAGFVAAMLAVSLLGGAASGGVTYLALSSGGASGDADVEIVQTDPDDAAPASTNTNSPLTTSNLDDTERYSIAQVAEKASPSVVEIACALEGMSFFGSYSTESSGSGVILTEDGYIVTNDHVVEDAITIVVRTEDGEEYEALLIGTDSKTDLAVLKIEATGLTPATFADSDDILVGETVVAIGNPLGSLGGTVTEGIISAKNREITIGDETMTLLQTSAAVNPGNSGGGLFNARGELVGVVNAKSYGVEIEGLGFAIPSNTVAGVVEDILEYGYVTGRPQLGISIVEINNQQAAMYYRVNEYGVYIAEVTRDNGLKAGDRVLRVNGEEIERAEQITGFVDASEVGDALEFEVERDGETVSVSVELVEKVPDYIQQAVETENLHYAGD